MTENNGNNKTNNSPILSVKGLNKTFQVKVGYFFARKVGTIHAVKNVGFDVPKGVAYGLVGESGCGKTTTGRIIARLLDADSGEVLFKGQNILKKKGEELRTLRRKIQFIFQDPLSSLNPRMTVFEIVAEPMQIHKTVPNIDVRKTVAQRLDEVRLGAGFLDRFPHQLSGGQRQRVLIARALALDPDFVVADEPVSALDVSVQAKVLGLLDKLRKERCFTTLFISHDLAVVRTVCQHTAVMYFGEIVETGASKEVFENPLHPYTKGLIDSAPDVGKRFTGKVIPGDVPDPLNPPSGCPFHPRCPRAEDICKEKAPAFERKMEGRYAACHFAAVKTDSSPPEN